MSSDSSGSAIAFSRSPGPLRWWGAFAGTAASLALHYSLTRPSIFILPADRDPIIVTQGKDNLVLGSYVTAIRQYDEILSFPLTVVLGAIGDARLKRNRSGVELGLEQRMGMPVGAYLDLVSRMPDTEIVDAADIFVRLRMLKSDEEIAYIRRAAEVTALARQRLFGQVAPGMTEREVARLMRQLVLEEGGDRTSFVIMQLDVAGRGTSSTTTDHCKLGPYSPLTRAHTAGCIQSTTCAWHL